MTENPPSTKDNAFDCPHCGAYTTQYWHVVNAYRMREENKTPYIDLDNMISSLEKDNLLDEDQKQNFLGYLEKIRSGTPFFEETTDQKFVYVVNNLHISSCYRCKKLSIWIFDRLIYPSSKGGVRPNNDLPEDLIKDFEEARNIVNLSPRGAAALLRLLVQKLCVYLGEKGESIDKDISSLVSKGLSPLIQKSLDIVRVIGNEAVHPGSLDLRDDHETATKLFALVNIIVEQMITVPNHINNMYKDLPESKRKGIEMRDADKSKKMP